MKTQDQSVDEFAYLLGHSRLTVCSPTPCYEIRGGRGNRRLVINGHEMTPEMTFSIRSLSEACFKDRQVVVATLSFSFDGQDMVNILASYIVNASGQQQSFA